MDVDSDDDEDDSEEEEEDDTPKKVYTFADLAYALFTWYCIGFTLLTFKFIVVFIKSLSQAATRRGRMNPQHLSLQRRLSPQ